MLIVVSLGRALFIVSFSMIASAVCALVGPLFVPFTSSRRMDLLGVGLRPSFSRSFLIIIANAFVFVFERFLSGFLQTLRPASGSRGSSCRTS